MNKIQFILIMCFNYFFISVGSTEEYYGRYQGEVKVEWLDEGREMKLLDDLIYYDPNNIEWKAPKGAIVNGASVPKVIWSIFGSPYVGKYRKASVIHDVACDKKNKTWRLVHLSFYYALRASGVNKLKAQTMYAAVYHLGPRWPIVEEVLIKPATIRWVEIPAKYTTVSEKVLVEPENIKWRRGNAPNDEIERVDEATGEITYLVNLPAKYKTVSKRVLVSPSTNKEVFSPAKYESVKILPPEKLLDDIKFQRLQKKIEEVSNSISEKEILSMITSFTN